MTLDTRIQLGKKLCHLCRPIFTDTIRLKEEIIANVIDSNLLTIQHSKSSYPRQDEILEDLCSEMCGTDEEYMRRL